MLGVPREGKENTQNTMRLSSIKSKPTKKILALSTAAVIAFLIAAYYAYSSLTRPPMISMLDISRYQDNPELYRIAKELKRGINSDRHMLVGISMETLKAVYMDDKRLSELISAALRQRENFSDKMKRRFNNARYEATRNFWNIFDFPQETMAYFKQIADDLFPAHEKDFYSDDIQSFAAIVSEIGMQGVSDALLDAAYDRTLEGNARASAIITYASLEGKNAVPHALKLMKDEDQDARNGAATAFCTISSVDEIAKAASKDRQLALCVLQGMFSTPNDKWRTDECAKFLYSLLKDGSPQVRHSALEFIMSYNYKGHPTHEEAVILMDIMRVKEDEVAGSLDGGIAQWWASEIVAVHLYANEKIQSNLQAIHKRPIKYKLSTEYYDIYGFRPVEEVEAPKELAPADEPTPLGDGDAEDAVKILLGRLYFSIGINFGSSLPILRYLMFREDVYKKVYDMYSGTKDRDEKFAFLEALACSQRPEVYEMITELMDSDLNSQAVGAKCLTLYGDRRGLAEIMRAIKGYNMEEAVKVFISRHLKHDSSEIYFSEKPFRSILTSFLSLAGQEDIAVACKEIPGLAIPFFWILAEESEVRAGYSAEKTVPLALDALEGEDKYLRLAALKLIESYGAIPGAGSDRRLIDLITKGLEDRDGGIREFALRIAVSNKMEAVNGTK